MLNVRDECCEKRRWFSRALMRLVGERRRDQSADILCESGCALQRGAVKLPERSYQRGSRLLGLCEDILDERRLEGGVDGKDLGHAAGVDGGVRRVRR